MRCCVCSNNSLEILMCRDLIIVDVTIRCARRPSLRPAPRRRRAAITQLKRPKFSPPGRYEARIARVTITARPAIFMPAVTKLPDIIPSH